MKCLKWIAAIFLCACVPAFAQSESGLQQTLVSAFQNFDLSHDQSAPFQLDVDVAVQFAKPLRGHLRLEWEAENRWRREISVGDFKQLEIRNDNWRYTVRNTNFTPARIQQLVELLGLNRINRSWIAPKEKDRTVHGVEERCIEAEPMIDAGDKKTGKFPVHKVCLSALSNDILSDEWHEGEDEVHRKEFDGYVAFASHRYPRKLELLVDGTAVITAEVVGLGAATFSESLFAPPPGAIARRDCDDMKQPVLLNSPELDMPPAARERGGGQLAVSMTIGLDGVPSNIQLSGSSGIPLDAATLRILNSYRFKPAMCGTEPVVSDISVELGFSVSPSSDW